MANDTSTTSAAPIPAGGFLRLPGVLQRIPVSRSTWWMGIRSGKYPKPVKLSQRTSAWRESDIDALCRELGKE